MPTAKIAIQLYTVRDELSRDFDHTIRKLAQMGYQGVEFAGIYGHGPRSARRLLDSLGLQTAALHLSMEMLAADPNEVKSLAEILGTPYVVCASLPDDLRDLNGFREAAVQLRQIGRQLREDGLKLAYHNHDFEFVKFGGQYGLDILLEQAGPDLLAELDLGWILAGGEDPVEYLRKYADRCPLVHLKDVADPATPQFTELGCGVLDLNGILAATDELNVQWLIVEEDDPSIAPLESARISISNLLDCLQQ